MRSMIKWIILTIYAVAVQLALPLWTTYAQSDDITFRARVIAIENLNEAADSPSAGGQTLTVAVLDGPLSGQDITFDQFATSRKLPYRQGTEVIINRTITPEGGNVYYIVDVVRTSALKTLFLMFAGVALIVGGLKSFRSLAGLAISFVIILNYILPRLTAGDDPVWTAVIGSILMAPAMFFLTHGWSLKTTIALSATLSALAITALVGNAFIELAMISGLASEEAQFLTMVGKAYDVRGLVLAGIIIGSLGILDDVTISQTSIVSELVSANDKLRRGELFWRAMRVGRDHIAATVNTLVLVYTGAALPLLLLFVNSSQPISQIVSYEIVAEEIVRTLVGSIGLISAIPLTTILAVWLLPKRRL